MSRQLHMNEAAEREANEIAFRFMQSSDVVGDMSRAYGADLSSVRVHTDESAAQRVEGTGADALSTGRDVFFGRGVFDRGNPASRGLLAHELAHSLQQGVGGGEAGAVEQSVPEGAEQGGKIMDFFRRLFGQREMTISEPIDVRPDTSREAKRYQEAMNNKWLDDVDNMSREQLEEFIASGGGENMMGGSATRKINNQSVSSTSQREYAISRLVASSDREQLKSPALQAAVMEQFTRKVNEDMQAKSAADPTQSNVARAFRGNDAHLYAFNTMVNGLLPENREEMIATAFRNAGVNAQQAGDEDPGPGHHITQHNYDASVAATDSVAQSLLNQSPEVMSLLEQSQAAFDGIEAFESAEDRSKMMMNNFMLRSIAPSLVRPAAADPAMREAMRSAQLYANNDFAQPRAGGFSGFLTNLFRRRR